VPATFNARAETVDQKPMFRDAFRRKRCLIPVSKTSSILMSEGIT
jgi:putative SOS response-associated peptidase YedK